ncbi:unnamed protein product [Effrenium voratum]|nr:unnamed protein product [Effrenium voratum]
MTPDRRERLQENAAQLHSLLASVAKADSPLELVSSPASYLQQLRCRQSEGAEERLVEISQRLRSAGWYAQVCSPSQCGSEGAFGARLGVLQVAAPSLRFCCSAEHCAEDLARLTEALKSAL